MTDYTLTEDDRKMLTEFIGEEYSEYIRGYPDDNCTFTTWDDLGALVKALQEKREWLDFKRFAHMNYGPDNYGEAEEFTAWLLNPARFAWLVKEWMDVDRFFHDQGEENLSGSNRQPTD
jgi:ABC-type glycerol-3-phosphate transport system substrate-binding protein